MIEYQLAYLGVTKQNTYIYNPSQVIEEILQLKSNTLSKTKTIKLLYLGSLYDKRNPINLLEAIQKLNNEGNTISIDFYGNITDIDIINNIKSFNFSKHLGYCNNVMEIYGNYDILVDIDADIPNDVFISSKLSNYLLIDLPVIAITPLLSPSKELVMQCEKSVYCCTNNEEKITEAIKSLIYSFDNSFSDRVEVRGNLNINNISAKYVSLLNQLFSKKTSF